MGQTVAVMGASPLEERYANRAMKLLLQKGHQVVLINPKYSEIEGLKCHPELRDYKGPIDTITLYINGQTSTQALEQILLVKPKRVIFNPGSENQYLAEALRKEGITTLQACTLVLLNTGQF